MHLVALMWMTPHLYYLSQRNAWLHILKAGLIIYTAIWCQTG